MNSFNYDWRNRQRRQDIGLSYLENGSFYFFRPQILRTFVNRLGGRIGHVEMSSWKMFEIDSISDFRKCEVLYNHFSGFADV